MVARTLLSVTQDLIRLFDRDLDKLVAELELFETEDSLWLTAAGVGNAAGNLALHIVGNLNQYIGVKLGGTDFVRDRPAEFALRDVSRADLVERLRRTKGMLETVLGGLDAARLEAIYPEEVLGYAMTTRYFLMHLYGHMNYHLGQINYLRRVLHG